ncbi:MAG: DUF2975 domain-containing protein [Pseudomonadota bacterium]
MNIDFTRQKAEPVRHALPPNAQRLVRIAAWVPMVVLGLLIFLFGYLVWAFAGGSTDPADMAATIFGMETEQAKLMLPENQSVVGIVTVVWILSLSSIIVALILSFQLLRGYATGRIFHLHQAVRLRRIGWMMVVAAPMMIFGTTIGHYLLGRAINPEATTVSIGIQHIHLLMVAFGLLIVVVGHVMRTALAIAEENENFV